MVLDKGALLLREVGAVVLLLRVGLEKLQVQDPALETKSSNVSTKKVSCTQDSKKLCSQEHQLREMTHRGCVRVGISLLPPAPWHLQLWSFCWKSLDQSNVSATKLAPNTHLLTSACSLMLTISSICLT